jgi:hypothetical protein
MNQSLRDQFRDVLSGWPIGRGYESITVGTDEARDMADAILQHLIDERYAVVRVVEPSEYTKDRGAMWNDYPFVGCKADADEVITVGASCEFIYEINPLEAHNLAVDLLSAAAYHTESRP